MWQHVGCVIIPEKPTDGVLPAPPEIFFCEICRLRRADPYVIPVFFPLLCLELDLNACFMIFERAFLLVWY